MIPSPLRQLAAAIKAEGDTTRRGQGGRLGDQLSRRQAPAPKYPRDPACGRPAPVLPVPYSHFERDAVPFARTIPLHFSPHTPSPSLPAVTPECYNIFRIFPKVDCKISQRLLRTADREVRTQRPLFFFGFFWYADNWGLGTASGHAGRLWCRLIRGAN